ncbi:MAG TPA: MarC family protein [Holophaga sp.]|jgi:multiple antibiotic resistance protein|nr:MarC family protein [Holophaga sp.]
MDGFAYRMLFAFLALFPILNPPAMAPIFLQLTSGISEGERSRLAFLIGLYTFILLTVLLYVGGWVLKLLGISIPVISIAGGLLLFHSAWRMLNRDPRLSESEKQEIRPSVQDRAFFPLTLPVTAGPGSIAVTLSLVPSGSILEWGVLSQFLALTCGIALAALTVFIFYRFASGMLQRLGKTGEATISQVAAFVLLAIGVQIIWNGIRGLLRTL